MSHDHDTPGGAFCCSADALPGDVGAAAHAIEVNPANAPARLAPIQVDTLPPERLAVLTGKLWPVGSKLRVAFLAGSTATQDRVMLHARAWSEHANLDFVAVTPRESPDILVGFDQAGYWSMLGTDSRMEASRGRRSVNLQGFDRSPPESEWRRVVRHEFGHAVGCPHEQQAPEIVARLDPAKTYAYFGGPPNRWSRQMVDDNILTPWPAGSVTYRLGLAPSIMLYDFPGAITVDGRPIVGGSDITAEDGAFIASIYPGRGVIAPPTPPPGPGPGPAAHPLLVVGGPGIHQPIREPGGLSVFLLDWDGSGKLAIEVLLRGAGRLEPIATLGPEGKKVARLKFAGGVASGIAAPAGRYVLKVSHPVPAMAGPCWARASRP